MEAPPGRRIHLYRLDIDLRSCTHTHTHHFLSISSLPNGRVLFTWLTASESYVSGTRPFRCAGNEVDSSEPRGGS